jgi:hypothetical protein
MTPIESRRKYANPIHIAPLFSWLLLALFVACCGLLFVFIKNQQHFLLASRLARSAPPDPVRKAKCCWPDFGAVFFAERASSARVDRAAADSDHCIAKDRAARAAEKDVCLRRLPAKVSSVRWKARRRAAIACGDGRRLYRVLSA